MGFKSKQRQALGLLIAEQLGLSVHTAASIIPEDPLHRLRLSLLTYSG
jgi:hypothetical protein